MGRLAIALVAALGLLAVASASTAGAATKIGQTFNPSGSADCSGRTWLQSVSPLGQYAAPAPGVITLWSFRADGNPPGQISLKMARDAGGGSFTIVGQSISQAPIANIVNNYPTRIPVEAGDVIGFYASSGDCERTDFDYSYRFQSGDVLAGTTTSFDSGTGAQFDISALLEPDADCDDLGDESQDFFVDPSGCVPPAPPAAGDTVAPDTTIAKGPKAKTKKKTASFVFTSDDPDATFECRLDDRFGFASCASTESITVSPGRHTLEVRAKDPAGNADATPATYSWKVKKKKRR